MVRRICLLACVAVSTVYHTGDLFNCIRVGVILSVNLLSGKHLALEALGVGVTIDFLNELTVNYLICICMFSYCWSG